MTNVKNHDITKTWFWLLIALHLILWTLIPPLVRYSVPHDTIEAYVWSQHLIWGYDKNPWVPAAITRLASLFSGDSAWLLYAFGAFFSALALWSVWRLGREFLKPIYAFVGALVLEGCVYYTIVPPQLNDNAIQLGLWPLMTLFFYKAIKTQKTLFWILTSVIATLSLMTKYYAVFLLIAGLLFLLINSKARKSFSHYGIYIALILGFILILPHLFWLTQYDYITVNYVFIRTNGIPQTFFQTLHTVWKFGSHQILNFILPFLLMLLLLSKRQSESPSLTTHSILDRFDKQFLLIMGLSPFILTLFLALIFQWHLRPVWGTALSGLWGLIIIAFWSPRITEKGIKRFLIAITIVLIAWPMAYGLNIAFSKKQHQSENYPGCEIAHEITKIWRNHYHKPLKYVAGSRYIAGYIAFCSPDHPSVLMEWNPKLSTWIDMNDLREYGAVFVQDGYYGETYDGKMPKGIENGKKFPTRVLNDFPRLKLLPLKEFPWHRATKNSKPVTVMIGLLPPNS